MYSKVKISLGIASVRSSSKKLELFFFGFDGAFTAAMHEKQMVFVRMRQLISNYQPENPSTWTVCSQRVTISYYLMHFILFPTQAMGSVFHSGLYDDQSSV